MRPSRVPIDAMAVRVKRNATRLRSKEARVHGTRDRVRFVCAPLAETRAAVRVKAPREREARAPIRAMAWINHTAGGRMRLLLVPDVTTGVSFSTRTVRFRARPL